jgi:predicted nucleotidyltransferase component of viral defense system
MNKLTRRQLELINRRTIKYPLQIAEKDYYLVWAIQLVYNSALGSKLVFKGGTAIYHCYLPQKRFSEDLDFTSLDSSISSDEIAMVLESDGTFRVNKLFESDFTIKIERLQYQGLLGQPGNIKFEVDRHQNVVLPRTKTSYQNVWNVAAAAQVMDRREICAEKIRAVARRARYRDFYDLYFLINELEVVVDDAVEILRQKEIRTPVIAANIDSNWSVAKEEMESDLGSIYCSEEVANHEIEKLIHHLSFEDIESTK